VVASNPARPRPKLLSVKFNEETNLALTADRLTFWRKYRKTKAVHGEDWDVYYFLARDVNDVGLEVYEGQGCKVVHNLEEAGELKLSTLFRQVAADYYAEFGHKG